MNLIGTIRENKSWNDFVHLMGETQSNMLGNIGVLSQSIPLSFIDKRLCNGSLFCYVIYEIVNICQFQGGLVINDVSQVVNFLHFEHYISCYRFGVKETGHDVQVPSGNFHNIL